MEFRTVTFCGVLAALLLLSAPVFAGQPRLAIECPRGGEYYVEGQTQQVRVSTRIRKVIVELSRDGGATFKPLGVIDNTVPDMSARGVLSWAVTAPPSKLCVIRARDEAGLFSQHSQHFCIGGLDASGGALSPNSVSSETIADQSVIASKLADGSVTTPKLADAAVTTVKIADEAVSAEKINSGAASNHFLLAANGLGGASWITPGSILVSPNFGNQPIVTTSSVASGSVTTGDLTVTGNVVLPPNSIAAAALPASVTMQGNAFNGASQLVKLDNTGKLPAVDGSALTNLSSSSLNGQAASYYLSRANHTGTQTAATISDFDTQVRTSRLDQMATPTASVALGGQKITNLADPTNAQDAATKNYADSKVGKSGDTMTGSLLAAGNTVKIAAQAGAGDSGSATKLEVLRNDNSSAFKVTANGDVTVGGVMALQKAGTPAVVALATSGNVATDATVGNVFIIEMTGNVTLQAPINPVSGQRCIWRFRQPSSGGPFTLTLDAGANGFRFGTDIPSVTLSTGANKVDYMGAIWNAADSKWDVIAFVQGY